METNSQGRLLSDKQLAPLLGVAHQTLRKWRTLKQGPKFIRVGGRRIRYRLADVERYLSLNTYEHTGEYPT